MRAAEHLAQAADDMGRVLDVLDAMHADTPEYAAAVIDSMGLDRTCLAALRLLDVIVHLIAAEREDGAEVTTDQITEYIRDNITRGPNVSHPV